MKKRKYFAFVGCFLCFLLSCKPSDAENTVSELNQKLQETQSSMEENKNSIGIIEDISLMKVWNP